MSTSSTVTRPLAEACWVTRVLTAGPPAKLDASLSVSLARRRLAEELWALQCTVRERAAAEPDPPPEPEMMRLVTLVGGGLGESRSLGTDGQEVTMRRNVGWKTGSLFWTG